jgi:hypothetical protein
VLENAWESLRPELAENIGSPDVINEHSIRPSDFTGKVSDVEGAPKHQFVSAGFMPDAGTPKEEPTAKAAEQPPSEVLGGTSLGNSTQKPDVDNSQLEKLTSEAEDAGVVLSIETLKGLIRRDPETIKRVRMRIEQNTGRPAQFDPESQSASTQSTQRGAPLVSPSRRKTTQELARERIQARSGT